MDLNSFNKVAASVAQEFMATGLEPHQFFMWAVHKQNQMYELPIAETPGFSAITEPVSKRLDGFLKTLNKEIAEGHEIMALVKLYEQTVDQSRNNMYPVSAEALADTLQGYGLEEKQAEKLAHAFLEYAENQEDESLSYLDVLQMFILVSMADWHADLAVYNRSEALKYGIPLESVQNVVMNSNFTKLGENGEVLKDTNGKFLKGPNFVPPEEHISALLFEADNLTEEAHLVIEEANIAEQVTLPLLANPIAEVFTAIEEQNSWDADEEEEDDGEEEAKDETFALKA